MTWKLAAILALLAAALCLPAACGGGDDDDGRTGSADDDVADDDDAVTDDDTDADDDTTDDDTDDDDTADDDTEISFLFTEDFEDDTAGEEPGEPWVVETTGVANVTVVDFDAATDLSGQAARLSADGSLGAVAQMHADVDAPDEADVIELSLQLAFQSEGSSIFTIEDDGGIFYALGYSAGAGTKIGVFDFSTPEPTFTDCAAFTEGLYVGVRIWVNRVHNLISTTVNDLPCSDTDYMGESVATIGFQTTDSSEFLIDDIQGELGRDDLR